MCCSLVRVTRRRLEIEEENTLSWDIRRQRRRILAAVLSIRQTFAECPFSRQWNTSHRWVRFPDGHRAPATPRATFLSIFVFSVPNSVWANERNPTLLIFLTVFLLKLYILEVGRDCLTYLPPPTPGTRNGAHDLTHAMPLSLQFKALE